MIIIVVVDTTTEEVTELLVVHSSAPHFRTGEQAIQEDEGKLIIIFILFNDDKKFLHPI
jgi:hypothetical protein